MTETDRETEVESAAESPAEKPLPTDPKVIFLGGLFALALCWRLLMSQAKSCCQWSSPSPSSFCCSRSCAYSNACTFPECFASLFDTSFAYSERSSAWVRPVSGPLAIGRPSFPKAFPDSKRSQFRASAHQYAATVSATNREFGTSGTRQDAAGSSTGPALLATLFAGTRSFASGLVHDGAAFVFPTRIGRQFPASARGDIAALLAASGRPSTSRNKSKAISLPISSRITIMNAIVGIATAGVMWAHRRRRPNPLGNSRLLAELRAGRRARVGRADFPARGPADNRHILAGVSPRGSLFGHTSGRGRGGNAVASGETLHPQSCTRDPIARLLVLDVGIPGAILSVPMLAIAKTSATGSGR